MTNAEKYKTAEDRRRAYHDFCYTHRDCADCPAYREDSSCVNAWLDREALTVLRRGDCKILTLVLKGRYYDMIARGEKVEEYRELKPYWTSRMEDWMFAPFRIVAFSRGYTRPTMFFYAWSVRSSEYAPRWRRPHPEWGEPETPHYIIGLGERVEIVD